MKDHDSNATDPLDPADPVNRDSVSDSWGRAAAYDAYADGLHTYALGGLRHHEAASSAVYCAFVAADHHVAHLGDAEMLRPWLYAITRHYCRAGKLPRLRLTAGGGASPGSGAGYGFGSASAASAAAYGPGSASAPKDTAMAELERTLLSAELASLDWPDTDGLSGAHREMLELSVRHGMESRAVGMMLGKPAAESFELLSEAWHELERSLAAQALLRTSRRHCPELAALAEGWSGRLTAQRREPLVTHVDACSRCQYHLHKEIGAPQAPSILPHVPAPKALRERVLGDLLDTTAGKAAEKAAIAARLTRFDAFGFPVIATPRPANPLNEGSGPDDAAVTAGTERRRWLRRASAKLETVPGTDLDEGQIAPRRSHGAEAFADFRAESRQQPSASFANPANDFAGQATEVLAALRSESVGFDNSTDSSSADDTLINARRPGVFEDVWPDRSLPSRRPVPRNSVAAAVEGRRRGVDEARRATAPVGDAYEAAAAVAASMAAGDAAGAEVPPIAPVGMMPTAVMPLGMVPGRRAPRDGARGFSAQPRKRKPGAKSALASSAVLSGVGAAGVTAFVLFVPSAPSGNKALFTPPESGGNSARTPDYPRPSSNADAGPALPVAGDAHTGLPGGDTVTAQVVAAVLPTSASPSPPSMPGAPSSTVVDGPIQPLPSQSDPSTSSDPSGQLHISVSQRSNDPEDVDVTLWNSGTGPISWTATPDAPWLSLSATSGMLAGGGRTSIHVLVDSAAGPSAPWTAHVRFDPSGQMVSIHGKGRGGGGGGGGTPSGTPGSSPSGSTSTPPISTPSSPSTSPSASSPSTSSNSPSTTQPVGSGTTPSGASSTSQPSTTPTGTQTTLPTGPHPHH